MKRKLGGVTALVACGILCGCAAAHPGAPDADPPRGRLITRAEIERTGARTAWDVLQRTSTHLGLAPDPTGGPGGFHRRGLGRTVGVDRQPVVVVDGVRAHVSILFHLDASDIVTIRLLNGTDATTRYGTGASLGAIVIQTH
jgi:outer membrane cobalamin receptor